MQLAFISDHFIQTLSSKFLFRETSNIERRFFFFNITDYFKCTTFCKKAHSCKAAASNSCFKGGICDAWNQTTETLCMVGSEHELDMLLAWGKIGVNSSNAGWQPCGDCSPEAGAQGSLLELGLGITGGNSNSPALIFAASRMLWVGHYSFFQTRQILNASPPSFASMWMEGPAVHFPF